MSKKIQITEFKAIDKPHGKLLTVNLEEYLRKNRSFSREKEGKCFSMTIYKGNYRNNVNVIEYTGISFDFDDVNHDDSHKVKNILNEMGISYVTYSTFKNGMSNDTYRFRVCIPFEQKVSPEIYLNSWYIFTSKFNYITDLSTKDISRAMYLPTTQPEYKDKAFFKVIEGELLNAEIFAKENFDLIEPAKLIVESKIEESKEGRNSKLTSEAGKLRSKGYEYEELLSSLLELNKSMFTDPLPEKEVKSIAKSVSKYENKSNNQTNGKKSSKGGKSKEEKEPINPFDVYISLRGKRNFSFYNGDFYEFESENNYWKKMNGKYFESIIAQELIAMGMDFYESADVSNTINAIKVFSTIPPEPVPFWKKNNPLQHVIKTTNGIIHLNNYIDGKDYFKAGTCEDFFDIGYRKIVFDKDASAPTWIKFLNEMLSPDQITLLQEYMGYCLIADTSMGKMLFLIGDGANGKSVVCLIMRLIIGEAYCSFVPLEAMDMKKTYNLCSMHGSLVNICEEIGEIDKAEEGLLKNLVTGGRITVERKYKDPIDLTFSVRLIFATNNFPRFKDKSSGIWRRILAIHFRKQILDESKQNRNLVSEEWWRNSGELPGILNWALEGLVRLRCNGHFSISKDQLTYLDELKHKSNPVLEFIEDYLIVSPGSETSTTAVFSTYQNWSKENGYLSTSNKTFSEQVKKYFGAQIQYTSNPVNRNGVRTRLWVNLKLVNASDCQYKSAQYIYEACTPDTEGLL